MASNRLLIVLSVAIIFIGGCCCGGSVSSDDSEGLEVVQVESGDESANLLAMAPYTPLKITYAPSETESKSDYDWEVELSKAPEVWRKSTSVEEPISVADIASLSCPLARICIIGNKKPDGTSAAGKFLEIMKTCMAEKNGIVSLDIKDPNQWLFKEITPETTPGPIHLTVNISGPNTLRWSVTGVKNLKTVRFLQIEGGNPDNLATDFVSLYQRFKALDSLRLDYGENHFIRADRKLKKVDISSYQFMETLRNFGTIELDLRHVTHLTSEDINELGHTLSRNATKFRLIQIIARDGAVFDQIIHSRRVAMKIICEVAGGLPASIFVNGQQTSVNLNGSGLLKYVQKDVENLLLYNNFSDLSDEDWKDLHGLNNLTKLCIFSFPIDETDKLHRTLRNGRNTFGSMFMRKLLPAIHYPKLAIFEVDRPDEVDMCDYNQPLEMKSLHTFIMNKVEDAQLGQIIIGPFSDLTAAADWTFAHKGLSIIGTKELSESVLTDDHLLGYNHTVDLAGGLVEGIDGELVSPAITCDKQFTGNSSNVASVRVVCTGQHAHQKFHDPTNVLLNMMNKMPDSMKRLALDNPDVELLIHIYFASTVNSEFVPFASIRNVEHLSLIITQSISSDISDTISIQLIYSAIRNQNPAVLTSFHLTYSEEGIPDVDFDDLVRFCHERSLTKILLIESDEVEHRRIYGLDKTTKVLETTEIHLINRFAVDFKHLRILNFENKNNVDTLNAIIMANQLKKLPKLYIRCERELAHRLNIQIKEFAQLTIQLYTRDIVRTDLDRMEKKGQVYHLQLHNAYFARRLPDDVYELRMQIFSRLKKIHKTVASNVINKNYLRILDVRGDEVIMSTLTEQIRTILKSGNIRYNEIMPDWDTLYMDISAIRSIVANDYWLLNRFCLKFVYIRYDVYTYIANQYLQRIKSDIDGKHLMKYEYAAEALRNRMLLKRQASCYMNPNKFFD